jgi:hypothetical protein
MVFIVAFDVPVGKGSHQTATPVARPGKNDTGLELDLQQRHTGTPSIEPLKRVFWSAMRRRMKPQRWLVLAPVVFVRKSSQGSTLHPAPVGFFWWR